MKTKSVTKFSLSIALCGLLFISPLLWRGAGGEAFSQSVGISSTGADPATSALLDIDATNMVPKGLLIPRISLSSITDATTISSPANSLVVYNTNATMTNGNGVGYYFYCNTGCTTTGWKFMNAAGNGPGTSGQVLKSGGAGNPPQWGTLSVGGGQGGKGSALGSTMQTAYMDSLGMFTPHTNNCAGTEAFVPLFSGATIGFCIDKNEQAAAYWSDAKRTCMALGKRLPEPEEFQVACDNAGALSILTMTNNWEWASNFALPMYAGGNDGVGAAVFGNGGCNYAGWGWVGGNTGGRGSYAFRCVH